MIEPVFSCKRCGYCCQGDTTVSLTEKDQITMLRKLKMSRAEAEKKFWRVSGNSVQMKIVHGHCIFYKDGCSIHEGRPFRCREWPLVKAILKDRINLSTIRNSCPGIKQDATYEAICEVIEKLDEENS